jgi:rare lipoprotein A
VKRFNEYEDYTGKFIEGGIASWYGPNFHGRLTANGEIFDQYNLTAAHKTLSFDSIVKVVNQKSGKSVIVRINDRGPYVNNRIIDLSRKAAEEIDIINTGTADVKLYLLSDSKLPKNIKSESFTVQVGSFNNFRDAENLSRKLRKSSVVEAVINNYKYFRVYSGIFSNIAEARKHKQKLKELGYEGFVKQIEN